MLKVPEKHNTIRPNHTCDVYRSQVATWSDNIKALGIKEKDILLVELVDMSEENTAGVAKMHVATVAYLHPYGHALAVNVSNGINNQADQLIVLGESAGLTRIELLHSAADPNTPGGAYRNILAHLA